MHSCTTATGPGGNVDVFFVVAVSCVDRDRSSLPAKLSFASSQTASTAVTQQSPPVPDLFVCAVLFRLTSRLLCVPLVRVSVSVFVRISWPLNVFAGFADLFRKAAQLQRIPAVPKKRLGLRNYALL